MEKSAYSMPAVSVGDVVLWRHNRTSPAPAPALVTNVGTQGISVLIFPGDTRTGIPRDGVRHESDPALNTVLSDSGVWSDSEPLKRLKAIETVVAGLQGHLADRTTTRK